MIALALMLAQAAQASSLETAYIDCTRKNGELLDDGISDARTVGHAIAEACSTEQRAMGVEAFAAKPLTPAGREEAIRQFVAKRDEMATQFLLLERAANRKPSR